MHRAYRSRARGGRGFTLIELLVAMALIVLLMAVLSQAFVEGLETYRHLKGIGDLQERLRTAAVTLRTDVLAARRATDAFVREGLRTGVVDPVEADELRARFEAIRADACDLEIELLEVERQTTNPVARRVMRRTLDSLRGVKELAARMVDLLGLVRRPGTDSG